MKRKDRYIAITVAFGTAAILPSIVMRDSIEENETAVSNAANRDARQASSPADNNRSAKRKARPSYQHLIGQKLSADDPLSFDSWAENLSRNPHELKQRRSDLKHLKRAEVIAFKMIEEHADQLSTDRMPVELPLPMFDGKKSMVRFDHLSLDREKGGTLAGRMVDDPNVSVVLGFHKGETSGIIQGPDKILFFDAFDGEVVILRELDATSHQGDFKCDCMVHQAERAKAKQAAESESPGSGNSHERLPKGSTH